MLFRSKFERFLFCTERGMGNAWTRCWRCASDRSIRRARRIRRSVAHHSYFGGVSNKTTGLTCSNYALRNTLSCLESASSSSHQKSVRSIQISPLPSTYVESKNPHQNTHFQNLYWCLSGSCRSP